MAAFEVAVARDAAELLELLELLLVAGRAGRIAGVELPCDAGALRGAGALACGVEAFLCDLS